MLTLKVPWPGAPEWQTPPILMIRGCPRARACTRSRHAHAATREVGSWDRAVSACRSHRGREEAGAGPIVISPVTLFLDPPVTIEQTTLCFLESIFQVLDPVLSPYDSIN